MKRCTKCNTNKKNEEFAKLSASKDGLQCWCKACMKKYYQSYDVNKQFTKPKAMHVYVARKKRWCPLWLYNLVVTHDKMQLK